MKGESKDKLDAATLSASATPGTYSTHTLSCGFVSTRELDAAKSVGLSSEKLHLHICFG